MGLTVSAFADILKTDYAGPIQETLENTTAFLSRMEKHEIETGGNERYIPLRTGRTSSIGARNDGSDEELPAGDKPSYGHASYVTKSLYATLKISGKVMRSSRKPTYAFAKAQTQDVEDTTTDMKKDVNRQIFGIGDAELCYVTTQSSTTVTVGSKLYPTRPTRFLHVGQKVDVRVRSTLADLSNGTGLVLTAVSKANSTFTYATTAFTATTNTQSVYRQGNCAAAEIKEIMGLTGIVAPEDPEDIHGTTYCLAPKIGNISRDTAGNEFWKSQVLEDANDVNRTFSLSLITEAQDEIEIESSGEASIIVTNHAIRRVYGLQMAAAKSADMDVYELDGGFKALKCNDIPMTWDVECPDYHIFVLDESTFEFISQGDWMWLENNDSGGILMRLPGQDQYEAAMVKDCNLASRNPAGCCVIRHVAHN